MAGTEMDMVGVSKIIYIAANYLNKKPLKLI
jgi:hypothetical protein